MVRGETEKGYLHVAVVDGSGGVRRGGTGRGTGSPVPEEEGERGDDEEVALGG